MTTPAVSVVVPFHNSGSTIENCIQGLLAQEGHEAAELIFIDNNSADDSAEIVRRYPQIRLLAESKPGAYAARNAGLEEARAPLVALTDADCVADPDWLRKLQEGLAKPENGILIGHCRYPQNASLALKLLGRYENSKAEYVLHHLPASYHFAYANNMAVRKELFDSLGPFKEWRRAADSEFVHRVAAARPELRTAFHAPMRVNHLEFVRGRERAKRMGVYTQTNAQIESFTELNSWQRLIILARCLRPL
ncbi:MAG: glycosyltransferase family A protein [Planctomycetota bacterium]